MALNYLEMKADLQTFINADPDSLNKGATGQLNKAVRKISDLYEGRWNHLYTRDASITLDSTGLTGSYPSDINHLRFLAQLTKGRNQYRRETDYYINVSSPSALTTAPTRTITFWYGQGAGKTIYATYWRMLKEFADSAAEQYPDIPNSGDAILLIAKWMWLEQNQEEKTDVEYYKKLGIEAVRDLKSIDAGYDIENEASPTFAVESAFRFNNYNPETGGRSSNRGYSGSNALKDSSL